MLLPGGELSEFASGDQIITAAGETVKLIGYTEKWKPAAELIPRDKSEKKYEKILKKVDVQPVYPHGKADSSVKALALFYDDNVKAN